MSNRIKTLLKLLVSVALLTFLFLKIDLGAALDALIGAALWALALAGVVVLADRLLSCVRMWLLLRAKNVGITFLEVMRVYWIGDFAATFLPGGLAVDAFRAYGLSRGYAALREVVAAVALERLSGLLSILIVALSGATVGLITGRIAGSLFLVVLVFSAGGLAGATSLLWIGPPLLRRFKGAKSRLVQKLASLIEALLEYRSHPGEVLKIIGCSVALQLIRVTIVYILALGIGIRIGPLHYVVFVPVVYLMNMIPVSIGAWGVQEGGFVVMFNMVGVPGAEAMAISVLVRILVLIVALPGFPLYVRYGLGRRGEDAGAAEIPDSASGGEPGQA
ncbi:MAG: lysylphosphatidylglycerol synthase transmembrane domain-containing protein [Planctomycetota bacterium]|jgi:uncharacterized protein (TIRG00374 family)